MKIAAYIRVSSKNKSDHEPSAAGQERKLRAWAKAHGHMIAAVYRDEGLSGATPAAILATPNDLYQQLGLHKVLSPLRLRGLTALLSRMKRNARELAEAA